MYAYLSGRSVKLVQHVPPEDREDREYSPRGDVVGFSRASRRRLLLTFKRVRDFPTWSFVTLTFGRCFPRHFAEVARRLHRFHQALERRLARAVPMIWRLELQRRGAPHFHLLVPMALNVEDVAATWLRFVDGSRAELRKIHRWHLGDLDNRPCVEPMRSQRGAMAYAAKYLSKSSDVQTRGRVWGVRHRQELLHPVEIVELAREDAAAWLRIHRKFLRSVDRQAPAYRVKGRHNRRGAPIDNRQKVDLLKAAHGELLVPLAPRRSGLRTAFISSSTFMRWLHGRNTGLRGCVSQQGQSAGLPRPAAV